MPTLDWIGKNKVINHHMEVPYRVLEEQYSYGEDSENMIIHGDNLSALKSLLPQYEGKIKCIYIDPPYNTGNEGWVYNDNVNDPRIKKWLGEVVGAEGVDLSRHDKWLCMMYPRLKLLQRLLSDDGAIFISIDDNELFNLEMICNEIFGEINRVGLITLLSNPRGSQNSKNLSYVHEYMLVYSKNINCVNIGGVSKTDESLAEFKETEENGRKYRLLGLRKRGGAWKKEDRPNMFYPIYVNPNTGAVSLIKSDEYCIEEIPKRPTGELSRWCWGIPKFEAEKELLIGKRINRSKETDAWDVFRKDYVDALNGEIKSTKAKTIWDEKEVNYQNARNEIKSLFDSSEVFDYPKPTYIIKKIITMICYDKNSIILDSFAGSGTTAHAVMNMNKADGGNRKFILIEMCDYAETITAERVRRVIDGYGEGKKKVDGTGGGFRFYELGDKLLNGDYLNESVGTEKIREYVYFTETKQPLENKSDEPYFMGKYLDTAYYFYYEKNSVTTLDRAFLHTVKTISESYLIYADKCILSSEELEKFHIKFKKIPRDITRL